MPKDVEEISISLRRLALAKGSKVDEKNHQRLLALDPGETIGWAFFNAFELQQFGKLKEPLGDMMLTLEKLITDLNPEIIVIERFKLYPWQAKNQTWSAFPTIEIIGVVRFLTQKYRRTLVEQSASTAKSFFSDNMLRRIDLYRPNRHSRDAIRHACYFLTFVQK